jgi:4-carboxymuconolactone decarboxylase
MDNSIPPNNPSDDDRYQRGLTKLLEVVGQPGELVVTNLNTISPDFTKLLIEVTYGDIYSRPGLSIKNREMCAIAALATLGNAPRQLKGHIRGALIAGWTREEVLEVFIHMVVYGGFSTIINAILVAKEVFEELDKENATQS